MCRRRRGGDDGSHDGEDSMFGEDERCAANVLLSFPDAAVGSVQTEEDS
jgi:hypothetical protein